MHLYDILSFKTYFCRNAVGFIEWLRPVFRRSGLCRPVNANYVPVSTNYPDIGKHEPEYYLVKKDDTLYAISLLFDLDYGQLAQWNQIAPPSYTIRIGQKIRLSDPIWKKNSDLGSRGK